MEANLDQVAKELYGKIQTRFPDIKIADEQAQVLSKKEDIPKARFFEFEYSEHGKPLGTIAVSLDPDDGIVIKASGDLVDNDDPNDTHHGAYQFIRSFRKFARSHMLNYEVDSMGKSNLDKRDYEFHAKSGEEPMMESKMWGTTKVSYQDLGETRLIVKHSKPVNLDLAAGRTMHIDSIYIENQQGERFRYPVRHLNGARAMAQHIGHGGNPYDAIGQHVVSLSEELSKLRMFKGYVSRTPVVSEAMGTVNDKVINRIDDIKKQLHQLQRPTYYEEFAESFAPQEAREIPTEVMNDWVDRLTVRTFNEALKDVFPYIYKIVDESDIPVKELSPDDLLGEADQEDSYIANYRDEDDFREASEFENFMDSLLGESPDDDTNVLHGNPEAVAALKAEIDKGPLQGDPNRTDIIGQFIKDPELHDILSKTDPNEDAWPTVKAWLGKKNPEVAKQAWPESGDTTQATSTPPATEPATSEPATDPTAVAAAPTTDATAVDPTAVPPVAETGNDDPPWDVDPKEKQHGKTTPGKHGQGYSQARHLARQGLQKAIAQAVEKGAKPGTRIGDKTLHDMVLEAGLTYEECGLPPQGGEKPMAPPSEPAGAGLDDMKQFASGWWNKQEKNFTISGEGVKTKLLKQFRGKADDGDLKQMMMFIDKLDPSSSAHQKDRVLSLAGVKNQQEDLAHAHRVMESYIKGN